MMMDESWLEAWELPMPSGTAWDEKEMASEQVQHRHGETYNDIDEEQNVAAGCQLLEDVDLLAMDPACESSPTDLTAIIGSLLDDEPVEGYVLSEDDLQKAGGVVTDNGCVLDINDLLLQTGIQISSDDWPEMEPTACTIELNDLLPTQVAVFEGGFCQGGEMYEESVIGEAQVTAPEAEEAYSGLDRRKTGARKRKAFEADPLSMTTDSEVETKVVGGGRAGVEKRAKGSTGGGGAPLDKSSAEYRMRRDRNNKFVRASREKARQRHIEVEDSLSRVTVENRELRSRVETLTREVEILRGLFVSIGAEIPRDVVDRINIATQPL